MKNNLVLYFFTCHLTLDENIYMLVLTEFFLPLHYQTGHEIRDKSGNLFKGYGETESRNLRLPLVIYSRICV